MKKILISLLLISSYSFAQEYNTLSIGASTGFLSEMGDMKSEGYNPVFSIDLAKQITPAMSLSIEAMLGSASGSDSDANAFDVNFSAVSAALSYNLLNAFDLPKDYRKIGFYLSGGIGFMGYNGDNNGVEYEQNMFALKAMVLTSGIGIKYRVTDNIQCGLDLPLVIPMGPGLDDQWEGGFDFGFRSLMFGASYTLGNNDNNMEWINPVDIISTQINTVEKELEGLSIDSDGDGVADKFDQDNNTPKGVSVDGSGKPLDVDSDGVYDYLDSDPFTSPGVSVDTNGRELDTDGDGVPNSQDLEPNSANGATVNFQGKQIVGKGAFLPTVYFDFNSTEVSYANYQRLATVASVMKANPSYVLRVIGYADAVGSSDANYKLGIKRANGVIESLVNTFGISIDRMIADSQGENSPLTQDGAKMQSGITSDGLTKTQNVSGLNRRVQFIVE
tara:strand:- start:62 stop:1399 length:1338 start_codon:yes stop_codon:yes gene_type:complete